MRRAIIAFAALLCLLAVTHAAPLAAADEVPKIAPGGQYTINVPIIKPSSVILPEFGWEVRVYFYSSTNCFNEGYWWESDVGDWIYSGWYNHRLNRYAAGVWGLVDDPEERTISISAVVVPYPRDAEDIENFGMTEIPIGSNVNLRARLIVHDTYPTFNSEQETATFTVGGREYTYPYENASTATDVKYNLLGENLEAFIDIDSAGNYRLVFDQTTTVSVDNNAPLSGAITMPEPIYVNLTWTAGLEPSYTLPLEYKVVIAISLATVMGGIAAYIMLRKRSP